MEPCRLHPQNAAIEHCEICAAPLCDLCLWYADDGRRLCETHARLHEQTGASIQSPAHYDDALNPVRVGSAPTVDDKFTYRGNSVDVSAATAALIGVVTLFSCIGGAYILPFVAGVMGLAAWMNAKNALDPHRTRTFGVIGMLVGALTIIPIILFGCMFILMFGVMIASGNATP